MPFSYMPFNSGELADDTIYGAGWVLGVRIFFKRQAREKINTASAFPLLS